MCVREWLLKYNRKLFIKTNPLCLEPPPFRVAVSENHASVCQSVSQIGVTLYVMDFYLAECLHRFVDDQ